MNKNQIALDHVNLSVQNLKESVQFYEDLFDFKVVELGEGWSIVRNGDSMICLHEHHKPARPKEDGEEESHHKINHFALRMSEIDAFLEKLDSLNIELKYGGEHQYPHSRSWYVVDPSGHVIEVVKWNDNQIRF